MSDTPGSPATSIQPGDIVQLRAGGPAMTAGELDPKKGRRCVELVRNVNKDRFYSDAMLQPFQAVQTKFIIEFVGGADSQFRAVLQKIVDGANNPRGLASAVLLEVDAQPGETPESARHREKRGDDE